MQFLTYLNDHAMIRYAVIVGILMTLGMLLFLYNTQQKKSATSSVLTDMTAIAGDDLIDTQLDLAKAYLEMNQKNQAKTLLMQILKDGTDAHKTRARLLMKTL